MSDPQGLVALAAELRTDEEVLFGFLGRLEHRFADREGDVRAFVDEPGRFERLRRDAQQLVEQYPNPDQRPPLFGVPVGVKDIFHVDGLPTGGGSRLPPDELAGPEAASVTALQAAGALVLGKTVSTEFAYFAPGPTRNPHRLTHTPGGSSSGSAAAVAAGLATLALGTQTIGSICRPAAFCGVVGYKPSYDRISRAGVIPLAPSLDHVGTFTVDVAGATLAAKALISDFSPESSGPESSSSASSGGRPVLGIPDGRYLERASTIGLEHFESTADRLSSAGYEVRAVPALEDFEEVVARHSVILAAENADVHRDWFARFRELYHPKTAELIERGQGVSAEALAEAHAGQERLRGELSQLLDEHGLDLWISPAAPGPAPEGLGSTGDPVMNLPWSQAGLPSLSLPSGTAAGLPLGLQLVARWGADEALFRWAEGIEEVLA